MGENRRLISYRLPVIVIQSAAEVEASLLKHPTEDGTARKETSTSTDQERREADNLNSSFAASIAINGGDLGWASRNTMSSFPIAGASNDRSRGRKSKRPSCHARFFKNRSKKCRNTDLKCSVEDALLAIKKMRLNADEDENMD